VFPPKKLLSNQKNGSRTYFLCRDYSKRRRAEAENLRSKEMSAEAEEEKQKVFSPQRLLEKQKGESRR
jgi:hypothetical protein